LLLAFALFAQALDPINAHAATTDNPDAIAAAQTNCVPPPADMVAWYAGDGDASDVKGGANGTFQGDAKATASGKVGQAFLRMAMVISSRPQTTPR
jgi:hypothetical protein